MNIKDFAAIQIRRTAKSLCPEVKNTWDELNPMMRPLFDVVDTVGDAST
jgi:hypothetical protein